MDTSPQSERAPQSASPAAERWKHIGAEALAWFKTLTSAAVYATLIVTFGFQVARVEGRSMEPTLEDQDRLVVSKLSYALHDPELGDVVMLRHPNRPEQILVKRVVAGPGDTVAFRAGQLVRNGTPVREDFIPSERRSADNRPPETIPEGYYYVLGDHRNNSSDSRLFGSVPRMYIVGKIGARWWPVSKARTYQP